MPVTSVNVSCRVSSPNLSRLLLQFLRRLLLQKVRTKEKSLVTRFKASHYNGKFLVSHGKPKLDI